MRPGITRWQLMLLGLVLLIGLSVAPRGLAATCAGTGSATTSDFDGDGRADLAIGVPGEDLGATNQLTNAGAIQVVYGCTSGLDLTHKELWTQDSLSILDSAESGDQFGNAVATGDFNGDGRDDLVAGVPGEAVGALLRGGLVNVIYGSPTGLSETTTSNQVFYQDAPDVEGAAEANDAFGAAVAVGDFNNDGKDDLAVGAPEEDISTATDAGAVHIIFGSSTGLSAIAPIADQIFWQSFPTGVDETTETGDRFGASLAAGDFNGDARDDLAIGVPGEDVGSYVDAGMVQVLYGSASGLQMTSPADQVWDQSTAGVAGAPELGDEFGAALAAGNFNGGTKDDLAIGAPGEAVVDAGSAGLVHILLGTNSGLSATGSQFIHQDTTGVPGKAEGNDRYGAALAAGNFDSSSYDDLAVGAPGEEVGAVTGAGELTVFSGSATGLTLSTAQVWSQSTPDVEGAAEAGDNFAAALTAFDFNGDGRIDLAAGVPSEDVGSAAGAGAVNVLYATATGSGIDALGDQVFTSTDLGLDPAETNDEFSHALN